MKTAIIGYGKMGRFYDALIPASYIIDPYPIQQRASFTTVDEFIHYKQPVDLAIVATPTFTHSDIVKKLLQHNYDVLVEKPLDVSSSEALALERLARQKKCVLYQSTLERYNPLIKFLKHNVTTKEIDHIESFRCGPQPLWQHTSNPIFDLGIHDVDLWMHLYKGSVAWTVHAEYRPKARREILVYLKSGKCLRFDLLHKTVCLSDGSILDFNLSSSNNPMLEMLYDLSYQGFKMNEQWHREIAIIEQLKENEPLILHPL